MLEQRSRVTLTGRKSRDVDVDSFAQKYRSAKERGSAGEVSGWLAEQLGWWIEHLGWLYG